MAVRLWKNSSETYSNALVKKKERQRDVKTTNWYTPPQQQQQRRTLPGVQFFLFEFVGVGCQGCWLFLSLHRFEMVRRGSRKYFLDGCKGRKQLRSSHFGLAVDFSVAHQTNMFRCGVPTRPTSATDPTSVAGSHFSCTEVASCQMT